MLYSGLSSSGLDWKRMMSHCVETVTLVLGLSKRTSLPEFTAATGTRVKTRKPNSTRDGTGVGERMNFNLRNSSNAVQVCMSAPLDCTALGTLAVSS
jgi:hypothetical protein